MTLLAIIGAAAYLWGTWCLFPHSDWNALRLAPSFALRSGVELYPPLGGGPLSTWIYGPVGVILNLPATLAGSATRAVQIAGAINAVLMISPLALITFTSSPWQERKFATVILALAVMVLVLPRTSLTFQVADHSAAVFGLLATWLLSLNPLRPV